MITKKQRRFDVYLPSVHGRKWIGSSNNLMRAMNIGSTDGCKELGCPCCTYEIYDNRLKTDDISYIIKEVMKREKMLEERRRNSQINN